MSFPCFRVLQKNTFMTFLSETSYNDLIWFIIKSLLLQLSDFPSTTREFKYHFTIHIFQKAQTKWNSRKSIIFLLKFSQLFMLCDLFCSKCQPNKPSSELLKCLKQPIRSFQLKVFEAYTCHKKVNTTCKSVPEYRVSFPVYHFI